MLRKKDEQYEETEALRTFLAQLKGRKFKLDCGHLVTFGYYLGNDVTIYNGSKLKITCSFCSGCGYYPPDLPK